MVDFIISPLKEENYIYLYFQYVVFIIALVEIISYGEFVVKVAAPC